MSDHDTTPSKAQSTPLVIDPTLDPKGFRELCHSDPSTPVRIVYSSRSFHYPLDRSFHSR